MDSPLLAAPGLGEVKRRKLLDRFGSLEALASATDEEILKVVHLKPEGLAVLRESLGAWAGVKAREADDSPSVP